MIINYTNHKLLETFAIQDSIFEGFTYGHNLSAVNFTCANYYIQKQFCFRFQQVIMINMQSCNLWGKGNAIYDIHCNVNSPLLTQLLHMQSDHSRNVDKSKLDSKKPFLCVSLELNSGDELQIICDCMEITCESISDSEAKTERK